MRRAILHIGHAKTATTYLQHFLLLNEEVLAKRGYSVPSDFRALGYPDFRRLVTQGRTFSGNAAPLFHEIERGGSLVRFASLFNQNHNLILSSELLFYYVNATQNIAELLNDLGFRVEIVAYLPLYDRGMISGYLQNVRNHGVHGDPVEFLNDNPRIRYFRYGEILRELRNCRYVSKVVFRQFRKEALTGGSVEVDFLKQVAPELDSTHLRRPEANLNPSLSLEVFELLRVFNQTKIKAAVEAARQMERWLSPEERNSLFHYYFTERVAEVLRQRYGDDLDLLLQQVDWPANDHDAWSFNRFVVEPATVQADALIEALRAILQKVVWTSVAAADGNADSDSLAEARQRLADKGLGNRAKKRLTKE